MLSLRSYQTEAVEAVSSGVALASQRQLVVLPTGTGKTVVMAELARRLRRRTLVLVHREELAEQAAEKFEMVIPGIEVGIVQGRRNEVSARHVTVASVDTLQQPGRLAQLANNFPLVFADEAHHAVAPKWRRLLVWARCFEPGGAALVGFTATPQRADGVALGHVFESIAYERSLLWMIAQGYLCDLRGVRVRTRVDLDSVREVAGELDDEGLARVVNVANRNDLVIEGYRDHAQGRKALCYTVDVAHSEALAEAFRAAGFSAAAISGKTGEAKRRQILRDLRDGRLQVVTNVSVLTEGYDEPSVAAILMARPLVSQALYTQCVGRGLRLYPGKRDCLVIDFADNAGRMKLQALPTLAGRDLQVELRPGESFRHALERQVQVLGPRGEGLGLEVEAVDLFQRSRFNWLSLQGGAEMLLRLALREQLRLLPDPERSGYFHVWHECEGAREQLSDRALDVGYAVGLAEDWAREHSGPLARRNARWRKEPVTDKQRAELLRCGFAVKEGMTRGEASDLLDQIYAARRAAAR